MKVSGLLGIYKECLDDCVGENKNKLLDFCQSISLFCCVLLFFTGVPFVLAVIAWNSFAPNLLGFLNPNWLHIGFGDANCLYGFIICMSFLFSVLTVKAED